MVSLFTQKIRGPAVVLLAAAPFAWGWWAFALTGLWQALGAAQSGVDGEGFWLQSTPFFTPEQAQAAFFNVRAASAQSVALKLYALDLVYIVLGAAGAAAAIGFGLRRLGQERSWLVALLLAPLVYFIADLFETLVLLGAVASGHDGSSPLLGAAGVATAIKLPALFATTAIELVALATGLLVWLFQGVNRPIGASD